MRNLQLYISTDSQKQTRRKSPRGMTPSVESEGLTYFYRSYFVCIFVYFVTVILPVVLYGCETWYLSLKEEHRLRVSEKRVLRVFGSKREED